MGINPELLVSALCFIFDVPFMPIQLVWMSNLTSRMLGRNRIGDGWVAVSTEPDEVEMTEGHVRE
jgi:hypothetical protein